VASSGQCEKPEKSHCPDEGDCVGLQKLTFNCLLKKTIATFNELLNWNDAEPSIPFMINKGVPTDDLQCSEQLTHKKKKNQRKSPQ
jgi:hypothetical protein